MDAYEVLVLSHLYPRSDDPVYGRFVEHQCLALAKLDSLRVIAPSPWVSRGLDMLSPRWRSLATVPRAEVRSDLRVLRPRFVALPHALLFASSGARLYRGIKETVEAEHARRPVDLIHAHVAIPDGVAGVMVARDIGVPVVLTIHGADINTTLYRSPRLGELVVETCDAADVTIVVSNRLASELIEAGADGARLRVVANGVDTEELDEARPGGELAGGRWIVTAGNLTNTKGFDDLIRAMALLSPAYDDVRLALVGDGPERSQLRSIARELHVKDRVVFYGKQPPERLFRLMAAGDAFVLPSWREGFGIVYLEAMALGRPVVGCRGQGISDVIEDGVNGLLVDLRNPDGLAMALRRLLDDPAAAREMGERAAALVREKYTWDASAAKVHEVYREAVQARGASAGREQGEDGDAAVSARATAGGEDEVHEPGPKPPTSADRRRSGAATAPRRPRPMAWEIDEDGEEDQR